MSSQCLGRTKCAAARCLWVFVAVLAHWSPLHAQALDPNADSFVEQWRDVVPVGGGIRAGVMFVHEGIIENPDVATIFLPASSPSVLCVQVTSQDGRFAASGRYSVAGRSGPTSIRVARKFVNQLRSMKYKAAELAILASVGEACDTFVTGAWAPKELQRLSVLLNSRVPTFLALQAERSIDQISCTPLPDRAVAYSLRCDISIDRDNPAPAIGIRTRRGSNVTTIALPLRLR